jgi:hypothetical protein
MADGVVYVAYGEKAHLEACLSVRSLRNHHDWPVAVISDRQPENGKWLNVPDGSGGLAGRWAKVHLDQLTPFDRTLFLDADTRVYGDLSVGFAALDRGWDLVMVASPAQGDDAFMLLRERERQATAVELARGTLQLNTGVMWFRKSERLGDLFDEWRAEWSRWKHRDQGALLRAMQRVPVKLFLLGWPFNGGAVVAHRFGACGR